MESSAESLVRAFSNVVSDLWGINGVLYRFSAFWLRSSVVSLLISLNGVLC